MYKNTTGQNSKGGAVFMAAILIIGLVLSGCADDITNNDYYTNPDGSDGMPEIPGFVWVSGGSFKMGGSSDGDYTPVHTVILSGYYISKYQVTQEQYQAVMGYNPSSFSSSPADGEIQSKRPVEIVTWYDAVEFCNKLSEKEGLTPVYIITGRVPTYDPDNIPVSYPITSAVVTPNWINNGYRLPTEAQWEFAAKGGVKSVGYIYSGSNNPDEVAWYLGNCGGKTHEVGKKAPNELGIYDMSGNLYEWCWDWFGLYTGEVQENPMGASSGSLRVLRGGHWSGAASYVRSVYRVNNYPRDWSIGIGFRVSRP